MELNAHALISFLITIIKHFNSDHSLFLPWLLGSQSCEKTFRSARSMTGTFSTVINFSMLGLLRRLHRLQIQSNLQAESQVTGVKYPQIQKHKPKEGKNSLAIHSLDDISLSKIGEVVSQAEALAKSHVESLGMAGLLKAHKIWDSLPICSDDQSDGDSDSDFDEEVEVPSGPLLKTLVETTDENASDIEADIAALSTSDLIDPKLEHSLSISHFLS